MGNFMNALAWLGIIVGGVVLAILTYYAFMLFAKVVITLLPIIVILVVGGVMGMLTGGLIGGIIFFVSIVLAFVAHDKWEGSDLYQKIEGYFEKKTSV